MAMAMSLAVISLLSTVSLAERTTIADQNSKATNLQSGRRSVFLKDFGSGYGPSGVTVKLQCWVCHVSQMKLESRYSSCHVEQVAVTNGKGDAHFDKYLMECASPKVIVMDSSGQTVKSVDSWNCDDSGYWVASSNGGVCHGGPLEFEVELDKCSKADADPGMEGVGCCPELKLCKEPRPTDDAAYCDVSNPRHGKNCWSEREMCREQCISNYDAATSEAAQANPIWEIMPGMYCAGNWESDVRSRTAAPLAECKASCLALPSCVAITFGAEEGENACMMCTSSDWAKVPEDPMMWTTYAKKPCVARKTLTDMNIWYEDRDARESDCAWQCTSSGLYEWCTRSVFTSDGDGTCELYDCEA